MGRVRAVPVAGRLLPAGRRARGHCDGAVTLKIGFVGMDIATNKKVLVSQTGKKAEAAPGKGNDYSETSTPFVHVSPPSASFKMLSDLTPAPRFY